MLAATVLAHASSPLRLGWMIPQEVSQSGALVSKAPEMAVDGSGNVHLVWVEGTLYQEDMYYVKSSDQGNTWSDPETIDTALGSHDVSVAVDITGTVHACWWDGNPPHPPDLPYELLYAQRTSSGWAMGEPGVVVTNSWMTGPAIRAAGDDLHVVWSNRLEPAPDIYYSRRPIDGDEWLTPTVIMDTGPASQYAEMAVDKNGNLHLVWHENTKPDNEIMYVSGTVGIGETTWSSPVTVSADVTLNATSPNILVGPDDTVHIVFGMLVPGVLGQADTHDVYYASFLISNTEDISPTVIPNSRSRISEMLPADASPSIVVDGADNVHVLWNGKRGSDLWDRIYHAVSDDQGESWSQPMAISPDDAWPDGFPTAATGGTLVHVAWQQIGLEPDSDIYYTHSLPTSTLLPLALKDYS